MTFDPNKYRQKKLDRYETYIKSLKAQKINPKCIENTVSEAITVADNIVLNLQTNAGEKPELNAASMTTEGADGATSVIGTQAYRTGFGVDTQVGRVMMLEDSDDKIINETDGTDGFSAEDFTTDAAGLIVVTQTGSTSGSASILNGVTTT